jgi:hypothetical protein
MASRKPWLAQLSADELRERLRNAKEDRRDVWMIPDPEEIDWKDAEEAAEDERTIIEELRRRGEEP